MVDGSSVSRQSELGDCVSIQPFTLDGDGGGSRRAKLGYIFPEMPVRRDGSRGSRCEKHKQKRWEANTGKTQRRQEANTGKFL